MDSLKLNTDSSKSGLLQEDHLASVRRRNKRLIIIFFSIIISLALIIGGIIISLVYEYNLKSELPNPSLAINDFCSVSQSEFNCIASLSYAIKTNPNTDPNQVFILSLELAVEKFFNIISIMSKSDSKDAGSQSAFKGCSSLLRDAKSQLNNTLVVMGANPDIETQTYEQRRDMMAWIGSAMEDLRFCISDLGKIVHVSADLEEVGPSTVVDEARLKIHEVESLVRNSKDFLLNCETVNANFRFASENFYGEGSRNLILEYLPYFCVFGPQYFVLVFLFCFILRIR